MKKTLDININYCGMENLNFIQRFTTAYIHIETHADPNGQIYDPNVGGYCFGCRSPLCEMNKAEQMRCGFFFLFNTMTGNSATRRRFDNKPTEMQLLTGYNCFDEHSCGTDFTVDFLFGYTGYDYRVVTDIATFKNEIITSIDTGKPVIAKCAAHNPRFRLLSGYDGDALVCPPFRYDSERTEQPPAYDDIEALYIFGDKIPRRYTLKDGLANIRRVMEYNANEKIWDDYLIKLGGCDRYPSDDGIVTASPEERRYRADQWGDSCHHNFYIFCSFGGAFGCERLLNHELHKELFDPVLSELWGEFESQWVLVDAGHITHRFRQEQIWNIEDLERIATMSADACDAVATAQKAEKEMLAVIKQAIEILDKKGE